MTEWGAKVTPENVWKEYPRPQMVRENWTNLNGLWDYSITKKDVGETAPTEWQGKILVPYPLESQLSGVMKKIWPDNFLWYKRIVKVEKKDDKIYLLHFGAVDYEAIVWINGKKAGRHVGGNTPFRFDITEFLKSGDNEISIRVFDQSDNRSANNYQLVGKQTLRPSHIRYIAATGIWQTTWLEEVPEGYIDRLRIDTAHNPATITVKAFTKGKGGNKIRVTARFKGKKIAKVDGPLDGVTLEIKKAKLWDTENPNLYDLKIELLKGRKVIDTVDSYAGIRTIGKVRDAQGNLRFTLNDKVVFHWGPLDQGWWPDGLLAPPSDAAILADIKVMKDYGFNMVRAHIKVNPLRY
jgi:beta-galactosidase